MVEISASKGKKSSLRNLRSVNIYSRNSQSDIKSCLEFLRTFSEQKPTRVRVVSACLAQANAHLHRLKIEPEPPLLRLIAPPHPEPNGGWPGSWRARQPGSPHIITGLREAIKPGLGRLPPCTNPLPSGLRM